MPVKNDPAALRALLAQKLADKNLTGAEAEEIAAEAVKGGLLVKENKAVVESLIEALQTDSLDLTSADQQAAVNALLGKLDAKKPLKMDKAGSAPLPDGTVNYSALLAMQSQATVEKLPAASYAGKALGVDKKGEITLDLRRVSLDLAHPTERTVEALWALAREGQFKGMSPTMRKALQAKLTEAMLVAQRTPAQDPDKFKRMSALCAATAALGEMAVSWTPETIEAMFEIAEKSPNPMTQLLARRGLDKAKLTEAQQARLDAIPAVENAKDLYEAFKSARAEGLQAGYSSVKGPAAELVLSALTFAKSKDAVTNFMAAVKEWDALNPGYGGVLDADELGRMRAILDDYVQKSEQTAFVYGSLKNDAPKQRAAIVSERAVAQLKPGLEGASPAIGGVPLTRAQADFVLSILPNIRDVRTAENMARCLALAQSAFAPKSFSPWGSPQTPVKPLDPAAFEIFKRAASDYQDRLGASPDGKLDYKDLHDQLQVEVTDLQKTLSPRMAELKRAPPSWDGVQLSAEAAAWLELELRNHLKSTMSVDNLGRALKIWSAKTGGRIEGQEFAKFKAMVTEYKANWAGVTTFDFNKLERIASFKVEGKEIPLCKVNGKPVGMASFYDVVATSVTSGFDRSKMRFPWMADRWGYRARQLVELMDVVAEQSVRGEGPVALLAKQFPGKTITILGTGSDGGHGQLVYSVADASGRELGRFAQGSDGTVSQTTETFDPILLSATVGREGDLNAKVAPAINTTRYPLQNPYTVGDKIDVNVLDDKAKESATEGKPFSTQYKVVEGEILGWDAKGNYSIRYKTPAGEVKTETVPLSTIRKANNPHYFNPKGSLFSDVSININTDAALKEFLDGAQPIIDSHLPTDGSLANMSPKELARRQKACIEDLMKYAAQVKYPQEGKNVTDPASKEFEALIKAGRFPLGELAKIDRGVCRHQCIFEQLLLQQAGIDSRLASGAANTAANDFRGFHIWTEVTLADNERYLSDQTWSDPFIPLWAGAYSVDKERQEMYDRTARYDMQIVN